MRKFMVSFLIFVFVSLSFFSYTFAYDTRQLPWKLPEKLEGYKDSHKYILIYEYVDERYNIRNVWLLYSHLPFTFYLRSGFSYPSYVYNKAETLVYRLIDGTFVYQYTTTSNNNFYFEGYYYDDDIGRNVDLDYDEWLIYRDVIDKGCYPVASNVNLDFAGNIWDKSNGLYDLPHPDAQDDDDDSSLVGGIVGGILNGLKSLFIPERNIYQDIVNKFSDKFPIVNQIVGLFSNLYNLGENEPVFKITYDDIELKLIDFSSFEDYLPLVKNFTGAFLFLSFITREIKILPRIIRGRQ